MSDYQYTPAGAPPPAPSSRPSWLIPVGFAVLILVIAVLIVALITRDSDSGDSVAGSSTPATSQASAGSTGTANSQAPSTDPAVTCPQFTEQDDLPLSLCDKGEFVMNSQQGLVNWGAQIDVDGFFGLATEAAVKAFQGSESLAVDGIIGEDTWGALCPFTNNLCEPD